jgi:hypothetical protein
LGGVVNARRGEDDDAKAVQCEVQSAGGVGGDPGGADTESIGVPVPCAPGADRPLAEDGDGTTGELFVDGRKRKARDGEVEKEALFEEIGRLKVELDWLKKKAGLLE